MAMTLLSRMMQVQSEMKRVRDLDAEIEDTLRTGRSFMQLSDDFFARGDPLGGAKYFRLAVETYRRAETLAEQQAKGC